MTISYTLIKNASGPVAKRFWLDGGTDLALRSAANIYEGSATVVEVEGLKAFVRTRAKLPDTYAHCYGVPKLYSATRRKFRLAIQAKSSGETIARDRAHFEFREGQPGIWFLDYDRPADKPEARRGWPEIDEIIAEVIPGWTKAERVWLPSSSAFLYRGEAELIGPGGWRCYCVVDDASAIPDAMDFLHQGLWKAGHGRIDVGSVGQRLDRSLIDKTVAQPERLDFTASPILGDGLERRAPDPAFLPGGILATKGLKAAQPYKEWRRKDGAFQAAMEAALPDAERLCKAAASKAAHVRGAQTGRMEAVLWRAANSFELSGDFVLELQDGTQMTVAELLDSGTEDFHGARMPDPIEGAAYRGDRRIAVLYLRCNEGQRPRIYSHARGGRSFTLAHDSAQITIPTGERAEALQEALRVIRRRGDLFDYGGILARVSRAGRSEAVTAPWLADYLDRNVDWLKNYFSEKAEKWKTTPIDAPDWLPPRVLAQVGNWRLPVLDGTITAPIMRPDGSVLSKKGYDPATRLFLTGRHFGRVPDNPTREELEAAFKVLWHPFSQFPYASEVDRGVALAMVLTGVTRRTLPTAPGYILTAPTASSGKTLLAAAVQILASGASTPLTTKADKAEFDKVLAAELLSGSGSLFFDNVRDAVFNTTLEAFLTSPIYKTRLLGGNQSVAFPTNVLFLVTANNFAVSGDLWRRVLTVRLDAKCDAPEKRSFAFNPAHECERNRQAIVSAGLTLLRGFIVAGKPVVQAGGVASFEEWNALVRQCVLWLAREGIADGFGDPLESQTRSKEDDPAASLLARVIDRLIAVYGIGKEHDAHEMCAHPDLHEVLSEIDPLLNASKIGSFLNASKIGQWLALNRDKRVNGAWIEYSRKQPRTRRALWAVAKAEPDNAREA